MKLIRFIVRGLFTWSLLLFALGAAFTASPHAAEGVLGLVGFAVLAGAVAGRFVRRPAATVSDEQEVPGPVGGGAAVAQPAAQHIPGALGARMALGPESAEVGRPGALAVCFRGQVKAYVTRDSWQPLGSFAGLNSEHPEYRLVALMSVYAQSVLQGSGGVYTEQDAIAYALGELVPHELLEHDIPNPAHTAVALCLPADVLTPQNLHALRAQITERNAAQASAHDWHSAE